MTLFKTASCAACAGLAIIGCFWIAGFTERAHLWPFSPLTFISTHLFWSCPDLTSVTFDMTLTIGVIVTLRVTVALVVTSLIRLVYGVFGL